MPDRKKDDPRSFGVADSAAALESELRSFEELAATIAKMPLASEKAIERAAKATNEAARAQERIGERVRELLAVIQTAHARQQKSALLVVEVSRALESKSGALQGMLERLAAIGRRAGEITARVQQAAQKHAEAGATPATWLGDLEEARISLSTLVDEAASLAKDGGEAGLVDVARDADSLRQQLLAARNRLGLIRKQLGLGAGEGGDA